MLTECRGRYSHYFVNENDQLHGLYEEWHENGCLRKQCYYAYNNYHGEYKSYWNNGQLHCLTTYVNGNISGDTILYHDSGKPWAHYFHFNDGYNGEYKQWNTAQEITKHCFYVNGKEVSFKKLPHPGEIPEDRMYFNLKYNLPLLPVESNVKGN